MGDRFRGDCEGAEGNGDQTEEFVLERGFLSYTEEEGCAQAHKRTGGRGEERERERGGEGGRVEIGGREMRGERGERREGGKRGGEKGERKKEGTVEVSAR